MQKLIPLKLIVPNPFRYMDRYPIDKAKIEALIASMGRTGFWDNVVGRQRNGNTELAYGHHRWIAYEKRYGKNAKMPINVRDRISDEDMLRIMADENANEYGHSAEIEQETIRAVVVAYADGKIELGKPKKPGHVRYARSFRKGKFSDSKLTHPYTDESIAKFLGWIYPSGQAHTCVRVSLSALEAIELELVEQDTFRDLSRNQAHVVTSGATMIEKSYKTAANRQKTSTKDKEKLIKRGKSVAKQVAKSVATRLHSNGQTGIGVREAQVEMSKARAIAERPIGKKVPTVQKFVSKLTQNLDSMLGAKDPRWVKLNEVIKHRESIDNEVKKNLTVVLNRLVARCQAMIDAIGGNRPKLRR